MVRSPLGLPLGDRGLLPLPDALPGVGAGVVAGGPYTVPQRMLDTKYRGVQPDGDRGGSLSNGVGAFTPCFMSTTSFLFKPPAVGPQSGQGQRGLEPPSPAGPHIPSGIVLPAALKQAW